MPRVSALTVDHVARLARLSLTEEERLLFARQLEEILAWAESLQELDTSGVPPFAAGTPDDVLREDESRDGLAREGVLGASPDSRDGLFRVPRVIG